MVILLCLNTFGVYNDNIQFADDGMPSFYAAADNIDQAGFDIYHDENHLYIPDNSALDLEEIFIGSLFFRKYADIDPSWFWSYDFVGLSGSALKAQLEDKFNVSSALSRLDENINIAYTFAYNIGEMLYLQCFVFQ
jgi:hypothetical protein